MPDWQRGLGGSGASAALHHARMMCHGFLLSHACMKAGCGGCRRTPPRYWQRGLGGSGASAALHHHACLMTRVILEPVWNFCFGVSSLEAGCGKIQVWRHRGLERERQECLLAMGPRGLRRIRSAASSCVTR